MPFTAQEYYTTDPPGYLWTATFTMAPLVTVRGRDRYAEGQASIDMRLLSLIPVANDSRPRPQPGRPAALPERDDVVSRRWS